MRKKLFVYQLKNIPREFPQKNFLRTKCYHNERLKKLPSNWRVYWTGIVYWTYWFTQLVIILVFNLLPNVRSVANQVYSFVINEFSTLYKINTVDNVIKQLIEKCRLICRLMYDLCFMDVAWGSHGKIFDLIAHRLMKLITLFFFY